jgi:hypothetical protein
MLPNPHGWNHGCHGTPSPQSNSVTLLSLLGIEALCWERQGGNYLAAKCDWEIRTPHLSEGSVGTISTFV